MFRRLLTLLCLVMAGMAEAGGERETKNYCETTYRKASDVLAVSVAAMGGETLSAVNSLIWRAEGSLDQSVEHQGMGPWTATPSRYSETFYLDLQNGRGAWEYRHERADGSSEWIREIYDGSEVRALLLLEQQLALTHTSTDFTDGYSMLRRRIPPLLMQDALEQRVRVRWTGGIGPFVSMLYSLTDGQLLTLLMDADDLTLRRAEYLTDLPTFGDAAVTWRFSDYRQTDGLGLMPYRYEMLIDDRNYTDMQVTRISVNVPVDPYFHIPEDFRRPEPVALPARDSTDADVSQGARVETLAPGIHRVVSLRPGFHMPFIETEDFIIAFDAPAGFPLLHQLPAGEMAPGPDSGWLSQRYIDLIRESVPDKPLRYVVISHFHSDHAGGLRAFVAAGATLLATAADAPVIRQLVEERPHTIAPDALSRQEQPLRLEVVNGRKTLGEGADRVEIHSLDASPHTAEMLVLWHPGERLLMVSDILPAGGPLDGWLARTPIRPNVIYGVHYRQPRTTEAVRTPSSDSVSDPVAGVPIAGDRFIQIAGDWILDAGAVELPGVQSPDVPR